MTLDSIPPYRGRFAPSPTGPLHLGSLVAALGSWLMSRQANGQWLVRVEDLDAPRVVAGAVDSQLATLAAFALHPDGPVARQSIGGPRYQLALDALLASGDAFVCHCSRRNVADSGGVHQHCMRGAARDDPTIRLRVARGTVIGFDDVVHGPLEQDIAAEVGDFVLRRADGLWAYQIAVVVDDAAQEVTDVVRGADLLESTPRQILLQQRLGLPTPRYAHLPLVLDDEGRKLSKSLAAIPVDACQPMPALRAAWRLLGQRESALRLAASPRSALESALNAFDQALIPRTPSATLAASHNGFVTRDA